MNYFDILQDDMIIKILDIRCDEIEKQIEKLENLEDDYEEAEAEYFTLQGDRLIEDEWNRHFNQSPIDDEPNGFFHYYDPYDTDEIDQYYQDEIYLANLSSNI
uniref:Uncharacterized protein n=1 Tax=viral metagenome TaxID=1070528 RepID=A0A6C0CJR6_9ZZZZ